MRTAKAVVLMQAAALAFVAASLPAQGTPPATPGTPGAPAAGPKQSGVPVYRLRLMGVYDANSGDPLEGVEVSDALSGLKSLTTSTGTLSLLFLPEGGSLVHIRKVGYEPQTLPVSISPVDTQPITVILKPAVVLPTVNINEAATPKHVSSQLNSFEEHRKMGFGQFITDSVFRKYESTTLASFLGSRLSGIELVNTNARTYMVSSRTPCRGGAVMGGCTHPNCFVTIFIDGVRMFDATMPPASAPDISRITLTEYTAAEYYPGGGPLPAGIPPTNSQCGTLMLYTRER